MCVCKVKLELYHSNSISNIESAHNFILSVSVNYSTVMTLTISDISISAEAEALPYYFVPEVSNCESIGHGNEVFHSKLDNLIPEWVGSFDCYRTRFLCGYCQLMDAVWKLICCKS